MSTTDAAPQTTSTPVPPPNGATPAIGALATVTPSPGAPPPLPESKPASPAPKNAQALASLDADERAAELPSAPSKTMNAFASGYTFETAQRMANALASSSIVPKAYQGNPANCMIAMEVANRTNMSVFAVMQNLDIVHGNPSWRSKFLIAMANSSKKFSRLKWSWVSEQGKDDWGCRAYATDLADGEKIVGPLVSIAIAKAEGWYDRTGSKWKTIPELMLMYRSAGWWARLYDPEDSMGFGTVEEAEDVHGVEFDAKIANVGMKDAPGAEQANQGRRMSLRPSPGAAAAAMQEPVDAEVVEGNAQAPGAPTTVAASAAPPPHETPPAEPRAVVASGTEGAAVAARLARESGTEPEDKGDAPSAEELATGKPAPRGRRHATP